MRRAGVADVVPSVPWAPGMSPRLNAGAILPTSAPAWAITPRSAQARSSAMATTSTEHKINGYVEMAPCWIRLQKLRSRPPFVIGPVIIGRVVVVVTGSMETLLVAWWSTAAGHAADFLLPLRAEREDEDVAHERGVLAERDVRAPALLRDLVEARLQLPVEVRERRDLLQLVAVEPPMELPLVLGVQREAHVDGGDVAVAVPPIGDEAMNGRQVALVRRRAADDDDHLLRVGAPF